LVDAEGDGWKLPPPAGLTRYGVTEEADLASVGVRLVPQPCKTLTQPLRLVNAVETRRPKNFIACVEPPAAGWRDGMIERVHTEPGWHYRELATGHDAMVTVPRELADLLLKIT